MASLTRSLKSPSFLSAKRRPAMSARSVSNSSELSASSQLNSPVDECNEFIFSLPGTPALVSPTEEPQLDRQEHQDGLMTSGSRSTSRPIAIELPQIKKHASSPPTYTPTEPLSARGDLHGGYFPLHEDPDNRVHRTHPFHHEPKAPRSQVRTAPAAAQPERPGRKDPKNPPAPPRQSPSLHMSSYIPAGFHDRPLPLGKYYPSNYENRSRESGAARPHATPSPLPPSTNSDSRVTTRATQAATASNHESEVRRKLLQYQRDMVAQATMAATEVLGTTKDGLKSYSGSSQATTILPDLRLGASSQHKPISPRLLPLGSPGPVTPMELESEPGSYLDRGLPKDGSREDGLGPPGVGYTARTT